MSASYDTTEYFSNIVKPTDEIRNEMEKFGFKFDSPNSKADLIGCCIPPGWKREVFPTSMRIYLPGTSYEFKMSYDPDFRTHIENDMFKFPIHERTILFKLLEYGFKYDCNLGTEIYPNGGLYDFGDLLIPKGWRVEMTWFLTYNVCQIYDPNNDKKYHIVTEFKKKYKNQ